MLRDFCSDAMEQQYRRRKEEELFSQHRAYLEGLFSSYGFTCIRHWNKSNQRYELRARRKISVEKYVATLESFLALTEQKQREKLQRIADSIE